MELISLVTAEALPAVLPLNEPIGHTAARVAAAIGPAAGPPQPGRPAGRVDRNREASPWDCSTARWRSSPAQGAASVAKRHSSLAGEGARVIVNDVGAGLHGEGARTRTRPRRSWH